MGEGVKLPLRLLYKHDVFWRIVDDDGFIITDSFPPSVGEAEFIVEAVNSHKALEDRVSELEAQLRPHEETGLKRENDRLRVRVQELISRIMSDMVKLRQTLYERIQNIERERDEARAEAARLRGENESLKSRTNP